MAERKRKAQKPAPPRASERPEGTDVVLVTTILGAVDEVIAAIRTGPLQERPRGITLGCRPTASLTLQAEEEAEGFGLALAPDGPTENDAQTAAIADAERSARSAVQRELQRQVDLITCGRACQKTVRDPRIEIVPQGPMRAFVVRPLPFGLTRYETTAKATGTQVVK